MNYNLFIEVCYPNGIKTQKKFKMPKANIDKSLW